jgi:RNase P subunit RPR2
MNECTNCKVPIGDDAKRAGVHIDDGAREVFCPRCFVGLRAPMELGRYAAEHYAAVRCVGCGWESVDIGMGRCAQCRSTHIVTLPLTPMETAP